jgi:hypothetical protein
VKISQSSFFGSNHVTTNTGGGGLGGSVLTVGAAAAMVVFAMTVGALVGGAAALAITVLAWTGAGCLALSSLTRNALHVAHWRTTRQLPPQRPLLTVNRPLPYDQIEAPVAARMRVTRADYPGRVYPGERDAL